MEPADHCQKNPQGNEIESGVQADGSCKRTEATPKKKAECSMDSDVLDMAIDIEEHLSDTDKDRKQRKNKRSKKLYTNLELCDTITTDITGLKAFGAV